jgi:hypothetical protein
MTVTLYNVKSTVRARGRWCFRPALPQGEIYCNRYQLHRYDLETKRDRGGGR